MIKYQPPGEQEIPAIKTSRSSHKPQNSKNSSESTDMGRKGTFGSFQSSRSDTKKRIAASDSRVSKSLEDYSEESEDKLRPQASRCLRLPTDLPMFLSEGDMTKAILPEVKTNTMIATWDVTEGLEQRKHCYMQQITKTESPAELVDTNNGEEVPVEEPVVAKKSAVHETTTEKRATNATIISVELGDSHSRSRSLKMRDDVEMEETLLPTEEEEFDAVRGSVFRASNPSAQDSIYVPNGGFSTMPAHPPVAVPNEFEADESHKSSYEQGGGDFQPFNEEEKDEEKAKIEEKLSFKVEKQGSELIWTAQLLMRLGIYDVREINYWDELNNVILMRNQNSEASFFIVFV